MKYIWQFFLLAFIIISCDSALKLDSNSYSLEPFNPYIYADPNDERTLEDSLLTDLFISKDSLVITFQDSYRKAFKILEIKNEKEWIEMMIDYRKGYEYAFHRENDTLYFIADGNWYIMKKQDKRLSIDANFPNLNQILAYQDNYEIHGPVKIVTRDTYFKQLKFGEEDLVHSKRFIQKYNQFGKILYCSESILEDSDVYSLQSKTTYNYNQLNQLVSKVEKTYSNIGNSENIIEYSYNKHNLLDFIGEEYNFDRFYYDDSLRIKTIDNFSIFKNLYETDTSLDYKTKMTYEDNVKKGIFYDGYSGEKITDNIYDRDFSLVKGRIKDCDYLVTKSIEGTLVAKIHKFWRRTWESERLMEEYYFYDKNCNLINEKLVYKDMNEKISESVFYYTYKLDEHGNWIYRQKTCLRSPIYKEGTVFIDKRKITYL